VGLALAFVAAAEKTRNQAGASRLEPWQQFAQVLLLMNETMFVD
jgi:hypothetical protein